MSVDPKSIVTVEDLEYTKQTTDASIAPVETSSTASKAYKVEERFWFKGKLCICTVDIPSGGTITLNTNCKLDVLGDDVSEIEKNYAKTDGYYEEMAVGLSEQLIATVGDNDKVPYNFRTSGGTADVGDRESDKLVGGTIAWNQFLAQSVGTGHGLSLTSFSAGSFSNGILNFKTYSTSSRFGPVSQEVYTGHKYLFTITARATSGSGHMYGHNLTNGWDGSHKVVLTSEYQTYSWIANCAFTGTITNGDYPFWLSKNTSDDTALVGEAKNIMWFDLTQMFGETVANYIYSLETTHFGDGTSWFFKMFPNKYYSYNAGELMSVNTSAHVTTGFNQWDEVWELGSIGSGVNVADNTKIRSKNYIPVIPNTTYYVKSSAMLYIWAYDASKNCIAASAVGKQNATYTTGSDEYYIRFRADGSYGTTYKNDICINLSWTGYRNGEYEPYEQNTYALDSSLTLLGVPKIDASGNLYYDGDTYEADGKVTRRYEKGNLLYDLNWNWNASKQSWTLDSGSYSTMYARLKCPPSNDDLANVLANGYTIYTNNDFGSNGQNLPDKSFSIGASGCVYFKDSSVTSTSYNGCKEKANSVIAVYELAISTTEAAEPYKNPQKVNDFGTEEYVDASVATSARDVAVPVGHDTLYMENLRDKLQHLPNLADEDGAYVIYQENDKMSLAPIADHVPTSVKSVEVNSYTSGKSFYRTSANTPATDSITTVGTFWLTNAVSAIAGMRGKLLKSMTINCKTDNQTLSVMGYDGEVPSTGTTTELSDAADTASASSYELFSIKTTAGVSTYKLDGSDDRVTLKRLPVCPQSLGLFKTGNDAIFKFYNNNTATDTVQFIHHNYDAKRSNEIAVDFTVFTNAEALILTKADNSTVFSIYQNVGRLAGKKISFLADSITTYSGYMPSGYATFYPSGDIQNVNQTWWKQLIDETGLVLGTNAAWSGSTVTGDSTSTSSAAAGCSTARITDLGSNGDPDIVIVYIGINDFGLTNNRAVGDWVGTTAIPSEGTITTFSEAYALMLYKVMSAYPSAKVYACTLLETSKSNYDQDGEPQAFPTTNGIGVKLEEYNSRIRLVAESVGAKVIDIHGCGISHWNTATYTGDGIHPNADGAVLLKDAVKAKLLNDFC